MEAIHRLVAFAATIEAQEGVIQLSEDYLWPKWVEIANASDEPALYEAMPIQAQDIYKAWLDKWMPPAASIPEEPVPEPEPEKLVEPVAEDRELEPVAANTKPAKPERRVRHVKGDKS